jgi:hypothetical protein
VIEMPEKTEDGRPYQRGPGHEKLALWLPEPPKSGDYAFCQGTFVGTFYGPPGSRLGDGQSYIRTIPLVEMPFELAVHLRPRVIEPGGVID